VNESPRVIFVNRVYWPATAATAQLLTDLAEGLARRGWAVHVIASGSNATIRNGVTIHRTGEGPPAPGLLSRWRDHRRFTQAACAELKNFVQPGDIVVPMTDPPTLGIAVTKAVASRGVRVIPWLQDIYPEIASYHFGALATIALWPLKLRRNRIWHQAASCVVLGQDMAGTLLNQGVPREKVIVIPNGAPRELHTPAPDREVAAHRMDRWQAEGKFVVAYSGNLGRVHEFATVVAAAEQLRGEPRIVFLFIGHGPRFDEITELARRRQLTNLRLLPAEPRGSLPASLRAADVHLVTLLPKYAKLVYPSKFAGVLAAGRPVIFIGPPEGDIATLIKEEDCGAAFAPGEARRLTEHIRRLAADSALCRAQAERARKLYLQEFTGDKALARWEDLLRLHSAKG
jgi:colanic acid biosynthesis glycosyl transferase WcaI